MNKKTLIAVLAAGLYLPMVTAQAEDLYGAAMGSFVIPDRSRHLGDGPGAIGLIGGELNSALNWEVNLWGTRLPVDNSPAYGKNFGLGADLAHFFNAGSVRPFILAGLGVQYDSLIDVAGHQGENETSPFINAGVGLVAPINDAIGFRGEIRGYLAEYNTPIPGRQEAYNIRLNLGLTFGAYKGHTEVAEAAPPTPAAPVAAAPAPAPAAPVAKPAPAPVAPAPAPAKAELKGVNFALDSSKLDAKATATLDEAVSALKSSPSTAVEIDGYADATGTPPYNQHLSERRADAVRKYLIAKGVAADRLSTKGYGEVNPLASNKTQEGRAINRCVQFKIK